MKNECGVRVGQITFRQVGWVVVTEREKLIFNTLVNFKRVKKFDNKGDIRDFRGFENSTSVYMYLCCSGFVEVNLAQEFGRLK